MTNELFWAHDTTAVDTYRSSTEANEWTASIEPVSGESNGIEDITKRRLDINVNQPWQVGRCTQRLWKRWTLDTHKETRRFYTKVQPYVWYGRYFFVLRTQQQRQHGIMSDFLSIATDHSVWHVYIMVKKILR